MVAQSPNTMLRCPQQDRGPCASLLGRALRTMVSCLGCAGTEGNLAVSFGVSMRVMHVIRVFACRRRQRATRARAISGRVRDRIGQIAGKSGAQASKGSD